MSQEEASQRVIGGMETVLAQLPPSSTTVWITQLACVPGCVLMLADAAVGDAEQGEEVLGESEDEQGELQGGFEVAGGASLHQHQQGPQLPRAAYHEGTWQIDVSQRSARNALCFFAFMSISSFEAAVGDGSLMTKFAAVVSRAAVAQEAEQASNTTQAAASGADPLVVASWGGTLQLALQLPEGQEQQQHRTPGAPSSSSAGRDGSSTSSKAVRLVLVQGHCVLIDQEVVAEVSGMTLSLFVQLPPMAATVCQAPTAAALYVLPAGSLLEEQRSSSGTRAAVAVAAGPLAHLTLLLLPPAAAAELLLWVDQLQLSQQQLQPLLEDMAVAVEACGIAAAAAALGPSPAATAAAARPAAAAAQLPSNAALMWAQAAAAAGRVLSLAHTCPQLRLCEDMMARCCQQLLIALRRAQPLAAGGLPSAEETSQLRLAANAAAEVTGEDGSISRSAAGEGPGPNPEEGMAKEGAKVVGSGGGEVLSAGKLDRSSPSAEDALLGPKPGKRMAEGRGTKVAVGPADREGASAGKSFGESSRVLGAELGADPSSRVAPAAAAMQPSMLWLWGCCVLGSLIGWRDRELEAGYLAVRMQGSRPSTWIAMGVIDIFTYGVMGVRSACYAYSSMSALQVGIMWYYLARYALAGVAYGLWLLLSPPSQWRLTGLVAVAVECVRIIGLEGYRCFNGGFETFYLLARSATSSKVGPTIIVAWVMTVRVVLHQLPPPWLLLHAAAMVLWLWRLQVNIPGWWPSASINHKEAWLQPLAFVAAGIAAVVSQEAVSRAAYIKGLRRRQ